MAESWEKRRARFLEQVKAELDKPEAYQRARAQREQARREAREPGPPRWLGPLPKDSPPPILYRKPEPPPPPAPEPKTQLGHPIGIDFRGELTSWVAVPLPKSSPHRRPPLSPMPPPPPRPKNAPPRKWRSQCESVDAEGRRRCCLYAGHQGTHHSAGSAWWHNGKIGS